MALNTFAERFFFLASQEELCHFFAVLFIVWTDGMGTFQGISTEIVFLFFYTSNDFIIEPMLFVENDPAFMMCALKLLI